jgi:hypothetical protein
LPCRRGPASHQFIGHQRLVVDAGPVAQTELALELGLGEIGVGANPFGVHLGGVDHHRSGAAGEGIPAPSRVPQVGGHVLVELGGGDRLEQVVLLGSIDPRRIHQHQQVGLALGPFALETLNQFVILAFEQVHLDARAAGEFAVEQFVGVVVAAGVDIHLLDAALGE